MLALLFKSDYFNWTKWLLEAAVTIWSVRLIIAAIIPALRESPRSWRAILKRHQPELNPAFICLLIVFFDATSNKLQNSETDEKDSKFAHEVEALTKQNDALTSQLRAAEEIAAEARKASELVRSQAAPRSITMKQATDFIELVRSFSNCSITIEFIRADDESQRYGISLGTLLLKAGYRVENGGDPIILGDSPSVTGLKIVVPQNWEDSPQHVKLIKSLLLVGIPFDIAASDKPGPVDSPLQIRIYPKPKLQLK